MVTDGECQLHNNTKNKFKSENLVLGQVNFINCYPINVPIEEGIVSINATLISDIPSKINSLILKDELDIAPVSSLAYIENKDKLIPLANLCIASNGPADSVLLFSKFPIEELKGLKIALSYASATSNILLEIILNRLLNLNTTFSIENYKLRDLPKGYAGALFIGDHALYEYSQVPREMFIYDLGSLWKKFTGLPMVFGLWVVRKEREKERSKEVEIIASKLKEAKEVGLGVAFEKVIKKSMDSILLSKNFYMLYFEHLTYDFNTDCQKGLEAFESYCKELKKAAVAL